MIINNKHYYSLSYIIIYCYTLLYIIPPRCRRCRDPRRADLCTYGSTYERTYVRMYIRTHVLMYVHAAILGGPRLLRGRRAAVAADRVHGRGVQVGSLPHLHASITIAMTMTMTITITTTTTTTTTTTSTNNNNKHITNN